jgi:predicted dehydrogenase
MALSISRRTLLAAATAARTAPAQTILLPRRIRVGIAGLEGHPGEIKGPLPFLPDVDVVAVASAPENAVRRFAGNEPRLAGLRRYDQLETMLDHERLDVLAVCNNNGARAAAVIQGLNRDLHVVAEKPFAIRRSDLNAVRAAAARSKGRLSMLLEMRFRPEFLALKQVVASGEIGEVLQISSQKTYRLGKREPWYQKEETYGSTLLWLGVHMIDLMRWISARELSHLASSMARIGLPQALEQETTAASLFRLDNGGNATMHLDYCLPEGSPDSRDDRLRFAGAQGVAEYQLATGVTVMTNRSKIRRVPEPPREWLFADFLNHVYNAKPVRLTTEDCFAVCELAMTAHEFAKAHGQGG